MMERRSARAAFLVRVVFHALVLQMIAIIVLSIATQTDIFLLEKVFLGLDFVNGHMAVQFHLEGRNPYDIERFVWLPPALVLLRPFAGMAWSDAVQSFFVIILAAGGLAVFIGARALRLGGSTGYFLLILFLYFPFQHLLDRGNLDSLILLFLVLFLASSRRPAMAGGFLSLAVGLKAFPVVLLGPLFMHRSWRIIAGFVVSAFAVAAATAPLWPSAVASILRRGTETLGSFDNTSTFMPFFYLGDVLNTYSGGSSGSLLLLVPAAVFFLTLVPAVLGDGLRVFAHGGSRDPESASTLSSVLLYVPWMVAVPMTVFPYTLLHLLLVLMIFVRMVADRDDVPRRTLFIAGWLLTATETWAWDSLTGFEAVKILPAAGVMILMVWVAWFKWSDRARGDPPGSSLTASPDPAGRESA